MLTSVTVTGFWGKRTVSLKLFEDVTFLIGTNGSGKTTLINLIAAALSADRKALEKFPFETVGLV